MASQDEVFDELEQERLVFGDSWFAFDVDEEPLFAPVRLSSDVILIWKPAIVILLAAPSVWDVHI